MKCGEAAKKVQIDVQEHEECAVRMQQPLIFCFLVFVFFLGFHSFWTRLWWIRCVYLSMKTIKSPKGHKIITFFHPYDLDHGSWTTDTNISSVSLSFSLTPWLVLWLRWAAVHVHKCKMRPIYIYMKNNRIGVAAKRWRFVSSHRRCCVVDRVSSLFFSGTNAESIWLAKPRRHWRTLESRIE